MCHRRAKRWFSPLFVLFLAAAVLAGCSLEEIDPVETPPVIPLPAISGGLSRVHESGGAFRDEFVFWIDQDEMGDIAALRFGGRLDEAPDPGDPDGFEFRINPEPDVPLFTAGQTAAVELLAEGGAVRATALFQGPAADLAILSPVDAAPVSRAGIEVQWRSDGLGPAGIRLVCLADGTSWETISENDGSYRISATKLTDFPAGPCSIEVTSEFDALLTSVELGGGYMTLVMCGQVVVELVD